MAGGLKPGAWVRELNIDGAVTLFNTQTQTALVLNDTASDVWRLLDGDHEVDDIVAELAEVYDADVGVVRAGVEDAIAQFHEYLLLESSP